MKINFGVFKGKKLIIGKNLKMRPTQSMAKSIIFNLLEITSNSMVLDLFSGTGALGFESASLGAKVVFWIDNNKDSTKAIKENIEHLKLDKNNYQVFNTDFRRALKKLPFKPTIIFLDPPFIATKYYEEALILILETKALAPNGIIILEKRKNVTIESLESYKIIVRRIMGEKEILFLKKNMNNDD